MQIIPAIDLMEGKVVRLTRGDPTKTKFYDDLGTPLEMAQKWKAQGAQRLHIIDLDAAFGKPDNLAAVNEIAQNTQLPIQVGGGIRNIEAATKLLSAGIRYVILGSLAIREPGSITQIQKKFGSDRIIVALDHKNGLVMIKGWTSATTLSLRNALKKYSELGAKSFLLTSIARDGTLAGPDLETLRQARRWSSGEIIAAGGIGTLQDLVSLKRVGADAAIVGKALYEERFTLSEAIASMKEN